MNNTNLNGESTFCTSPKNTFKNLLPSLEAEANYYLSRMPEGLRVIEQLKQEEYPDSASIKAAQERVRIWRRHTRWTGLLIELNTRIEDNPYPGQRMRLMAIATTLIPWVSPREWREIFFWVNIDINIKLYFPHVNSDLTLEDIESKLIEMMTKDNVIPASSLEIVIQSSPKSNQYRNVKHQLEQRGWYWIRRRKIPTTVIHPPLCH